MVGISFVVVTRFVLVVVVITVVDIDVANGVVGFVAVLGVVVVVVVGGGGGNVVCNEVVVAKVAHNLKPPRNTFSSLLHSSTVPFSSCNTCGPFPVCRYVLPDTARLSCPVSTSYCTTLASTSCKT